MSNRNQFAKIQLVELVSKDPPIIVRGGGVTCGCCDTWLPKNKLVEVINS